MDAHAALVAVAAALRAALRVGPEDGAVERPTERLFDDALLATLRHVGLLAVFADAAEQTLRADGDERGRDVKRLHAHLGDAGNGRRGVVGVERRDEKVACQRSFDGDLGRLLVADFADEDHVGVHAQVATERAGKREPDLTVHLHLIDAWKRVLDRVLRRLDVHVRRIDLGERGVERHRLAGAGRAAVQNHAVRLADALAVALQILLGETERGQRQRGLLFVEDAHHDFLAEVHRAGGDAQIDVDVLFREFFEDDAAILRQPTLGNVEVAHDLQAGDERVGGGLRQAQFFLAQAVDAVPHHQILFLRLDVDIRRAADVGVLDDAVGELDDRCGLLIFEVTGGDLGQGIAGVRVVDHVGDPTDVDAAVGVGFRPEVFFGERLDQRGRCDVDLLDGQFGGTLKGLALGVVERVGHQRDDGRRRQAFVGEHPLATDDGIADDLDQLFVDLDFLGLGDEGLVSELGDEARSVVGPDLKLRIEHSVQERGGVLGHLLEQLEVSLGEQSIGTGAEFLVEHLDCADDDIGLQRYRKHREHLETRAHVFERLGLRACLGEKERFARRDDLAHVARAQRQLHRQKFLGSLPEFLLLGRVLPPKRRRIVDLFEGDVVSLDEVKRHRLRLKRLDHLRGRELDHRGHIVTAGSRLGDDLDEKGSAQGICNGEGSHD
ncbi:MAG: hypothetical protein BWX86_02420 [Verrucomicrobia bacterium ADurb.Bin122]|nr:MAG: hypothetical protein BWX86_02420 [Verrucomicrobia bacterium ADurb.Bin122]